MTYDEIMKAAGQIGATYDTKQLAYDLGELKDKGILDAILPYSERSWRDIALTSGLLKDEFKRSVKSTIDARVEQHPVACGTETVLKQSPSFRGNGDLEDFPISENGFEDKSSFIEKLKKIRNEDGTIDTGDKILVPMSDGTMFPIEKTVQEIDNSLQLIKEQIQSVAEQNSGAVFEEFGFDTEHFDIGNIEVSDIPVPEPDILDTEIGNSIFEKFFEIVSDKI
jgi:hypothetical protein